MNLKILHKVIILSIPLLLSSKVHSQNNEEKNPPFWAFNITFGGGVSFLSGLNNEIYQNGHSNFQFGGTINRTIDSRNSILFGLEIDFMRFNLDAQISADNDQFIEFELAPDGIKYPSVRYSSFSIPIYYRFYFKPINNKESTSTYFQLGPRISFLGNSEFFYRENNNSVNENITSIQNNITTSIELLFGVKGNHWGSFDLLNSSNIGVIYQVTPIFSSGETIRPIHFTWRFIF